MVKIKEPGLLKTESTMTPLTSDSIFNDKSKDKEGIPAQIKDKKKAKTFKKHSKTSAHATKGFFILTFILMFFFQLVMSDLFGSFRAL